MARYVVGEARVDFLHAGDGGFDVRVALGMALFAVANRFDPVTHAVRCWPVYAVAGREAQSFDGDGLLHAGRVHAGIVQDDPAAEGMADQPDRKVVNDVEERGEIENVLGDTVSGPWGPGAVAVAAQIQGVNVIALAEDLGYPVPIARVVERAVDENKGGLAVLTVIPELQLEAVRVEE